MRIGDMLSEEQLARLQKKQEKEKQVLNEIQEANKIWEEETEEELPPPFERQARRLRFGRKNKERP